MSPALMGIIVTIGITVYAVVELRGLDTERAVRLGAIVVFLWLLTSEGDFLAIIGVVLYIVLSNGGTPMALDPYGHALVGRIERRALGHGPREEDALVLQPEVVVQVARQVLLHAEEAGSPAGG